MDVKGIDNLQHGYDRIEQQNSNMASSDAKSLDKGLKRSDGQNEAGENNDQPLSEKEQK